MRLLLLLLLSGSVHAADLTVKWTNPTKNDDGSPVGTLTQTRIEWGTCNVLAFAVKQGEVIVPQPAITTTLTGVPRGGDVCIRGYSKTDVESVASNVVKKWVPPLRPAAPAMDPIVELKL